MPSPTTVYDIVVKAMLHLGAIASGEVPNADEASDGLDAFNDVLETWSLQNLAIYGGDVEAFNTVAGQASYTIGPTGNWVTTRPQHDIAQAYCTVNSTDFPIGIWTQEEYNAVAVKQSGSQVIERLAYINDFPNGIIKLYPTPSAVVSVKLIWAAVLTSAPTLATVINLPPGYARALAYAVAVELSAQYGAGIDVSAQARSTLAYIKKANRTPPIVSFDSTLCGDRAAL